MELKKGLVLLVFLALVNYWPVLIGRVPFPAHVVTQFPPWETVRGSGFSTPRHAELGDLATQFYPWKCFLRGGAERATLPLWNRHVLLGAPFQAEPQTGLFYPLNLFYYVLPTQWVWAVGFLLRTVLAGALTLFFLRSIGATPAGSLAGGLVFAFCGFITAFQGRPQVDTSLWLPLVCLAVDRLQRRPGPSSTALAGVAFALPVLAGHVENAVHVALFGVAFFLFRFLWPAPPPDAAAAPSGRRRFLLGFAVAGLLALALAAVQILPTLEWAGEIGRTLDTKWTARPSPQILAFFSRDLSRNPNSANIPIPEGAAYAGMLTLLLAPLAFLHRNRRDALFFGLTVAALAQVIYGLGPLYWLSRVVPVVRGMPNGRLLVVVDFGLAVLAGVGLSALEERIGLNGWKRGFSRWWILPGAATATCALGVGFLLRRTVFEDLPAGWPANLSAALRSPSASAILLAGACLLVALAVAGRLKARTFAAFSVALMSLDLVSAGHGFVPFVAPGEIFPPAPVLDFLRSRGGRDRVGSVDVTYGANFEMMYGLSAAGGLDILLRRTARMLSTVCEPGDAAYLNSEKILKSGRVLDLMNVKYLVATTWNKSAEVLGSRPDRFAPVFSEGSVRVFENRNVLPRAFLVPASGAMSLDGDEDAEFDRVCTPVFDPEKTVVLAAASRSTAVTDPAGDAPQSHPPARSSVSRYEQGINELRLKVEVSEPSVLVVSQTFYPGWKAVVDGRKAEVLRADYAFTGVRVGQGSHDVALLFRPPSFRIGAWLSGAGAAVLLGLFTFSRLRKLHPYGP